MDDPSETPRCETLPSRSTEDDRITSLDDQDREELAAVAASIETFRRELRNDIEYFQQLPENTSTGTLAERCRNTRRRSDELLARFIELRELVESRCRTTERLRARLREVWGRFRPH